MTFLHIKHLHYLLLGTRYTIYPLSTTLTWIKYTIVKSSDTILDSTILYFTQVNSIPCTWRYDIMGHYGTRLPTRANLLVQPVDRLSPTRDIADSTIPTTPYRVNTCNITIKLGTTGGYGPTKPATTVQPLQDLPPPIASAKIGRLHVLKAYFDCSWRDEAIGKKNDRVASILTKLGQFEGSILYSSRIWLQDRSKTVSKTSDRPSIVRVPYISSVWYLKWCVVPKVVSPTQ